MTRRTMARERIPLKVWLFVVTLAILAGMVVDK